MSMSEATGRIRPTHPVLLYDDHYKFCRANAALVEAWDREDRLDLLPLSDELAARLLAPMSEAERLASIRVVQPVGTVTSGVEALLSALAELPAGSRLAGVAAATPPLASGVNARYGALARIRGSLAYIVPQRRPVRRWRGSIGPPGA
jgi:predicted DCC family thiol-disulfide oxidoreductase YuxK